MQLFNQYQDNVAAGVPNPARVSDIHVPKDVAIGAGSKKKERAGWGTVTKSTDPRKNSKREKRSELDLLTPPVSERTRSRNDKKPIVP